MRCKLLLFFFIGLCSALAQAKPAPWYWWGSRVGDARICAQTSPGQGWLREDRAFRDSHCSVRREL